MKLLLLFASTSLASGLLFANIYTSLIDAKSWGAGIPQSLETAREYFKTVNPKRFFRMIAPANLVAALLVLILFWKISVTVRVYSGLALALYVCVDVSPSLISIQEIRSCLKPLHYPILTRLKTL